MTTQTTDGLPVILASASPRRRELLAGLGLKLVIDPSAIPEPERRRNESPGSYVVRAARLKSREVAGRHAAGFIVSADTIVVVKNRFLGKPASAGEAAEMLNRISGRWHEVFTGICGVRKPEGRTGAAYCRSRVHMRHVTGAEIEWYLSTSEYRDKAGAYAIQGYASLFIDRIEGCYFNIVGFPIFTFAQLCRRLQVPLFG